MYRPTHFLIELLSWIQLKERMISKYCLLFLPFLLWTTHSLAQAPQKPPTRELADFFSSISKEELRALSRGQDTAEKLRLSKELSERLKSKEVGKQWTVHCYNSSIPSQRGQTLTSLSSDPIRGQIRANGERINVTISANFNPSLQDKAKRCRAGQKIFIAGTVQGIRLSMDAKFGLMADITMNADDIGPDK